MPLMTSHFRPASDKQIAFMWKLAAERVPLPWMDQDGEWAADLGVTGASNAIEALLNQPRKPVAHEDGEAVGEGFYWVNGLAYKVQGWSL